MGAPWRGLGLASLPGIESQTSEPRCPPARGFFFAVGFGRRSFLCDVARKLQRAAQWLWYYELPDGLMVSSTSAISPKPKPRFSPSRGFFLVGSVGAPHPGRLPLVNSTPALWPIHHEGIKNAAVPSNARPKSRR